MLDPWEEEAKRWWTKLLPHIPLQSFSTTVRMMHTNTQILRTQGQVEEGMLTTTQIPHPEMVLASIW